MERLFFNLRPSVFFSQYVECYVNLNDFGLILVRPDAYKNNSANEIYKDIKDKGYSLISAKLMKFDSRKFELLYNEKTSLFVPNVWLFEKIYDDSPCIAMIFKRNFLENNNSESVTKIFDDLKGNSSPIHGNKIGLREKIGRISSFHGVVHCSDSLESLRNDLMVIYNAPELVKILKTASDISTVIKPDIIYFYFENNEQMINSFDVVQFIIYLAKKILATACVNFFYLCDINQRAKYIQLFYKYNIFSKKIGVQMDFKERIKLFTMFQKLNKKCIYSCTCMKQNICDDICISETSKLQSVILQNDFHAVLSLLPLLGGYEGFNGVDISLVHSILERGGIFLTDWEKTILDAALTTDLNSDSEWCGRKIYDRD